MNGVGAGISKHLYLFLKDITGAFEQHNYVSGCFLFFLSSFFSPKIFILCVLLDDGNTTDPFDHRIVLERPEYGYATYFFELVDSLPINWQIKRLVVAMKLTSCSRITLIENKALLVIIWIDFSIHDFCYCGLNYCITWWIQIFLLLSVVNILINLLCYCILSIHCLTCYIRQGMILNPEAFFPRYLWIDVFCWVDHKLMLLLIRKWV